MAHKNIPTACQKQIDEQVKCMEEMKEEGFEYLSSIVQKKVRKLNQTQCSVGLTCTVHVVMEKEGRSSSSSLKPVVEDEVEMDVCSYVLLSSTMKANCTFYRYAFRQVCDMPHMFYINVVDGKKISNGWKVYLIKD